MGMDINAATLGSKSPFAGEAITVSSTAIGFTAGTAYPAGNAATAAVITCAAQPIRYRVDGTDPSATVGHVMNDKDSLVINGPASVALFKAIKDGATDAVIHVTYYR